MSKNGLFVGLVTLDLIYLTKSLPTNNQKLVALDYSVASGGPATNAAITYSSYFGNQATLMAVLGCHPITNLIINDLERKKIAIADLNPIFDQPPPVSSIMVTKATGERSVISINASKSQVNSKSIPDNILENVDIILIDGHQMMISEIIAQKAKLNNIPVVIDGGSWKVGFERVLPYVNYAICSANFYPPNCQNKVEVIEYLVSMGIEYIAITNGENPIDYYIQGKTGKIAVPKIENVVDTLGAGDIFHGAFCHYILTESFIDALIKSAKIASESCQFFGKISVTS